MADTRAATIVRVKLFLSLGANATQACWKLAQFQTFGRLQVVSRLMSMGRFSAVTTTM